MSSMCETKYVTGESTFGSTDPESRVPAAQMVRRLSRVSETATGADLGSIKYSSENLEASEAIAPIQDKILNMVAGAPGYPWLEQASSGLIQRSQQEQTLVRSSTGLDLTVSVCSGSRPAEAAASGTAACSGHLGFPLQSEQCPANLELMHEQRSDWSFNGASCVAQELAVHSTCGRSEHVVDGEGEYDPGHLDRGAASVASYLEFGDQGPSSEEPESAVIFNR